MVWLRLPGGEHARVGQLVFTDSGPDGRYRSAFRYNSAWLGHPRRFPLDPANLPLTPLEKQADMLDPPLGVVRDALPDGWGRRLNARRAQRENRQYHEADMLTVRGAFGLGALEFFPPESAPSTADPLSILCARRVAEAADRFDRGEELSNDLDILLQAGTSVGGARPKALVAGGDGRQWLAKFPLTRDVFDIVGLEYAAMRTAHDAGLEVPEVRLLSLGGNRRAYLVERFDVTPNGGRRHGISLAALLSDSGRRCAAVACYRDALDGIRRFSDMPVRDELSRLFRQAAFNAAIGNTDDHLKNLMLIHDDAGYRLSPVYDLLPNVSQRAEHAVAYGGTRHPPDRETLLHLAVRLDINAGGILDDVLAAAANFAAHARAGGVPAAQVELFAMDIRQRCDALSGEGERARQRRRGWAG